MTVVSADIRGLSLAYRDRVILQSVDLTVRLGGIHTVVGPVGAGKTSLLRTLAGQNFRPGAEVGGEVWIGGERLAPGYTGTLVAPQAAMIAGTVRSALAALGFAGGRERNSLEDLLETFDLLPLSQRESVDRPFLDLPTVDARLVVLAYAWIRARPRLLLLDDPTARLQHAEIFRYCEVLRRVCRLADTAVLVATEDGLSAREFGGETSLLAGGRILETQATPDFFSAPANGGRRVVHRHRNLFEPAPGRRRRPRNGDEIPRALRVAGRRSADARRCPHAAYADRPGAGLRHPPNRSPACLRPLTAQNEERRRDPAPFPPENRTFHGLVKNTRS